MFFKALITVLKFAAFAQQGLASPVGNSAIRISSRDTDVVSNTTTSGHIVLHPVQAPESHALAVDKQVVPQASLDLHFADANTTETDALAAVVTIPKLTHPAVNAVAASLISAVQCSGDQALVTFSTREAWDNAVLSWQDEFLMVTYSASCGTGDNDEKHDFILIHSIVSQSSEALTITLTFENIDLENAIDPETIVSMSYHLWSC